MRILLALALLFAIAAPAAAEPFDAWLQEFVAEARGRGYSDALLDQTLAGLTPLPRVIASDRRQPEKTMTLDAYLKRRITPAIVRRGREVADEHRDLLARVQAAYGVPPTIILAIWGIETGFGAYTGDIPVFQTLATLAWAPRRAGLFRAQLFDALTMVDAGHIDAPSMKGSWAGAMGQPQFMPSSYLAYAVDFDGDGRRDIWTSHADTFASIANYLKGHGWRGDEPWGFEVRVSPAAAKRIAFGTRRSGCRAMREMTAAAALTEWQRRGVRRDDGGGLPVDGDAALVRAGTRRFLVGANYDALLHYNCAHHYALAVAMLADQIQAGSSNLRGSLQ